MKLIFKKSVAEKISKYIILKQLQQTNQNQ